MSLGEKRRSARVDALTTAAELIRGTGESGASADEHGMTEEEFLMFCEECKKVYTFLEKKAYKLQFGETK